MNCRTICSSSIRPIAAPALYGDKIYMATVDACVVALMAETGEEVWDVCIADYTEGYYSTLVAARGRGHDRHLARPAANMAFAATWSLSMPRPARRPGRPTPFRVPASPATTPGPVRELEDRRRLGLDAAELRCRGQDLPMSRTGNGGP